VASATHEVIRIRMEAYDHSILDQSAAEIVDTAKRTHSEVHGPIPLPTRVERYTVLSGPTIDKKATRVAFESNNTGRYQIYTVRADGTGLVDISKNTVGDDRSARISADGDRVTWKSRWQLTNVGNDMFMNYPEGGTSRQWTFFGGMTTSNPNDSHGANGDGTILSFATRYNVGGGNPQADHEIFLWRDVFTRTGAATQHIPRSHSS